MSQSATDSWTSSCTDLASRIGDRICVHPEGNLHQQFEDSPLTQRKQQDQH